MSAVVMQRDLVVAYKKETLLNIGLLSKLEPMLPELSRLVFKENALDKPTQNLFNHLSYYLVSIIDTDIAKHLPWPLYDSKTERAYRSELYIFISDYSRKGMLSSVMSSYLVNPASFKITILIFQLSQLAVNKVLTLKMHKESQKKLYEEMTEKFKSEQNDNFIEAISKETEVMLRKFSNYLCKRQMLEKIAAKFCARIIGMEKKIALMNAQKYINDLVDGFISQHNLDDVTKEDILKVKNVCDQPQYFDNWLTEIDTNINKIVDEWDGKITPFLNTCRCTSEVTEAIILRYTGQIEKSLYMIEYHPKTDAICTKDLEKQVNSEQKYVLRNLEKDRKLYMPNLIRAFVISICFILKDNNIGDQIYKFNDYLQSGGNNFRQNVETLRMVLGRIFSAEAKLQITSLPVKRSLPLRDYTPIPILSDLKTSNDHIHSLFDTVTPVAFSKQKFNLRRNDNKSFGKPLSKILITPFHYAPRDDFMKSIISYNINSYDHRSESRNVNNLSVMSEMKGNETIAECASGFTRQQIQRLLSTKKTSSSKKYKNSAERPIVNVKKGDLFNESCSSIQSNGLTRSYSSPNLFENRQKRQFCRGKGTKLAIMKEDSNFEVSGILALDSSNFSILGVANAESSRKYSCSPALPTIVVSSDGDKINIHTGLNSEVTKVIESTAHENQVIKSIESQKTETPKSNTHIIKKTSSVEKIINRFKKLRASVMPEKDDIIMIQEEKESKQNDNRDYAVNRVLLPDLVSPSCSVISNGMADNFDQIVFLDDKNHKSSRESLGMVLGVDQTFLDQFDLID